MTYPTQSSSQIQPELGAGEHLLWSSQPRQGLMLRGADAFMIPFSLLWGGFAFFWEGTVLVSGAPFFFALWGIPFVLVGMYMIFGRFLVEAKQRETTWYGVTNERIIIVSGLFSRKVKSLNLRTLTDLSLTQTKNGEGSISFGSGSPFGAMFSGLAAWPGMEAYLGPRFDMITNVKTVYETIRTAQRTAA
jgi:Bacterial PH domain